MIGKLSRMRRDERGITGLETAIILIAFVVVAAVFAYTALSAGLFSTQKSQETIYSGLKEAQSTLELKGSVIGYWANISGTIVMGKIEMQVSIVSGGEPINLTAPNAVTGTYAAGTEAITSQTPGPTIVTFSSSSTTEDEMTWTLSWVGKTDGDSMLEEGETAVMTVWFNAPAVGAGNNDWTSGSAPYIGTNYVQTSDTFTVEVKPATGAVLVCERTTPDKLDTIMDLH